MLRSSPLRLEAHETLIFPGGIAPVCLCRSGRKILTEGRTWSGLGARLGQPQHSALQYFPSIDSGIVREILEHWQDLGP